MPSQAFISFCPQQQKAAAPTGDSTLEAQQMKQQRAEKAAVAAALDGITPIYKTRTDLLQQQTDSC